MTTCKTAYGLYWSLDFKMGRPGSMTFGGQGGRIFVGTSWSRRMRNSMPWHRSVFSLGLFGNFPGLCFQAEEME